MWKKYQGGKYLIKKVENIRTQGGILSSQFKKYQIQMWSLLKVIWKWFIDSSFAFKQWEQVFQVQISYLRGHVPTSKLHLRRLNNNNGNLSGTATGTATSIASEGDEIEIGPRQSLIVFL